MIGKVCFKCGYLKPLDEFYKHPQMKDGHLNKCKECTRCDMVDDYYKNRKNDEWVKKERERSKEKYYRLGYKNRHQSLVSKRGISINDYKVASHWLRNKIDGMEFNLQIHHWNYGLLYDIFVVSKKDHRMLHTKMVYDKESKVFFIKGTREVLDTHEKHKQYLDSLGIYSVHKSYKRNL